jgi:hypothetical protein
MFRKTALLRMPVDAMTGEATTLEGDALKAAQDAGTVILKSSFLRRQYNHRLVDIASGKPTRLQGEALEAAIEAKTVVNRMAYNYQRSLQPAKRKYSNEELDVAHDLAALSEVAADSKENANKRRLGNASGLNQSGLFAQSSRTSQDTHNSAKSSVLTQLKN